MCPEKIKENLKEDLRTLGLNHLNSKVNELFDFAIEITNRNLNSQSEIITALNKRIEIYQEVIAERYA